MQPLSEQVPWREHDGLYSGRLDNGGETCAWQHNWQYRFGVTYNDRAPWPLAADVMASLLCLETPLRLPTRTTARTGGQRAGVVRLRRRSGHDDWRGGDQRILTQTDPLRRCDEVFNPTADEVDSALVPER